MENNKSKKARITCYYFDGIIKLEENDLDNALMNEKSNENILICDILYKTLINLKPLLSRFDKIDGFIRIYDGTRYQHCFALKDMMLFMTGLDDL